MRETPETAAVEEVTAVIGDLQITVRRPSTRSRGQGPQLPERREVPACPSHSRSLTGRALGEVSGISEGRMIRLEILIELKFLNSFKLFELFLLLKLDKQFSIEQFEPTVSQSTVSSLTWQRAGSRPTAPSASELARCGWAPAVLETVESYGDLTTIFNFTNY